jgi:hypothetical protein
MVSLSLALGGGRLAWRAISNSLGVGTVQSLPLLTIVAMVTLGLVVASLAAFAPGVSAGLPAPYTKQPRTVGESMTNS